MLLLGAAHDCLTTQPMPILFSTQARNWAHLIFCGVGFDAENSTMVAARAEQCALPSAVRRGPPRLHRQFELAPRKKCERHFAAAPVRQSLRQLLDRAHAIVVLLRRGCLELLLGKTGRQSVQALVRHGRKQLLPTRNVRNRTRNGHVETRNAQVPKRNTRIPKENLQVRTRNAQAPMKNLHIPNRIPRVPSQDDHVPKRNLRVPGYLLDTPVPFESNCLLTRQERKKREADRFRPTCCQLAIGSRDPPTPARRKTKLTHAELTTCCQLKTGSTWIDARTIL